VRHSKIKNACRRTKCVELSLNFSRIGYAEDFETPANEQFPDEGDYLRLVIDNKKLG
jgi:hypothetical protein